MSNIVKTSSIKYCIHTHNLHLSILVRILNISDLSILSLSTHFIHRITYHLLLDIPQTQSRGALPLQLNRRFRDVQHEEILRLDILLNLH